MKKKNARPEICYKVATPKLGMFGLKVLCSIITILLAAAFVFGCFSTTKADRVLYVLLPYGFMLPPIGFIVFDMLNFWEMREVASKELYFHAVTQLRRCCIVTMVFGIVTLLADFVYVLFVNKDAALKGELRFLLMCALCAVFALVLFALNRCVKCEEMGKFDAPPPPPPRERPAEKKREAR